MPWIELLLDAVTSQSADAVARGERIIELREREPYRALATKVGPSTLSKRLTDLMNAVRGDEVDEAN